MKAFNKVNFHGTASLTLSDADNAEIFKTPNHAIHFLRATGLVDRMMEVFDDGLFVIAFKSPVYENKESELEEYSTYSVFNFGAQAAVYVNEFHGRNCVVQHFMTKKECEKLYIEMQD